METMLTTAPLPATQTSAAAKNQLRGVEADDFIKLLITELQNQDPLDPTDNGKILEQISQIRSIQTTTQLSETLGSVLLGQNLASASALVGKRVVGLADDGANIAGRVERISIENGAPRLVVDGQLMSLSNIREILSD